MTEKYSIVYASNTGNTRLLADAIADALPKTDCIYCGKPLEDALMADILFVGFWTDKGTCPEEIAEFLGKLQKKKVFLFGTAGFGGEDAYFEKIVERVSVNLAPENTLLGSYMCQGKMPSSVRARYEQMLTQPNHMPNLESIIENFDKALSHPNSSDLSKLEQKVKTIISKTR